MATDSTGDVSLPPDLAAWLDEHTAALEVERDELVAQLVGAYRVTAGADGADPVAELVDEHHGGGGLEAAVEDALSERHEDISASITERVEERLDAFEADLEGDLDEMRRRIVQVRDATKQRATADHDHEEFERLSPADDGGDVAARLDDVETNLDRVARAVVALQREGQTGNGTAARLAEIKRAAAREGVTEAVCTACGESVALAVLPAPTCPHCEVDFDGLAYEGGVFGSSSLTTDGGRTDE